MKFKFLFCICSIALSLQFLAISPAYADDKEDLRLKKGKELEVVLTEYLKKHHGFGIDSAFKNMNGLTDEEFNDAIVKFRDALLKTTSIRNFTNVNRITFFSSKKAWSLQSGEDKTIPEITELKLAIDEPAEAWIEFISVNPINEQAYEDFFINKNPRELLKHFFVGVGLYTGDIKPADVLRFLSVLYRKAKRDSLEKRYALVDITLFNDDRMIKSNQPTSEGYAESFLVGINEKSIIELYEELKRYPVFSSEEGRRARAIRSLTIIELKKILAIQMVSQGASISSAQFLEGLINLNMKLSSGTKSPFGTEIVITSCSWCNDDEFDYEDGDANVEYVIKLYMEKLKKDDE